MKTIIKAPKSEATSTAIIDAMVYTISQSDSIDIGQIAICLSERNTIMLV